MTGSVVESIYLRHSSLIVDLRVRRSPTKYPSIPYSSFHRRYLIWHSEFNACCIIAIFHRLMCFVTSSILLSRSVCARLFSSSPFVRRAKMVRYLSVDKTLPLFVVGVPCQSISEAKNLFAFKLGELIFRTKTTAAATAMPCCAFRPHHTAQLQSWLTENAFPFDFLNFSCFSFVQIFIATFLFSLSFATMNVERTHHIRMLKCTSHSIWAIHESATLLWVMVFATHYGKWTVWNFSKNSIIFNITYIFVRSSLVDWFLWHFSMLNQFRGMCCKESSTQSGSVVGTTTTTFALASFNAHVLSTRKRREKIQF